MLLLVELIVENKGRHVTLKCSSKSQIVYLLIVKVKLGNYGNKMSLIINNDNVETL